MVVTGEGSVSCQRGYRGNSLVRKRRPLGPYSRPMPRTLWWSNGGEGFLSEMVQGYLACKKETPPRTLQCAYVWGHMAVKGGGRFLSARVHGYLCRKKAPPPRTLLSERVQGYLVCKKAPPPRTLQKAFAQGPMVVTWGGGASYKRGCRRSIARKKPPPPRTLL